MKTSQWTTTLVASAAFTLGAPAFADVGMIDGQDQFSSFKSTASRAEVRSEIEAARSQGLMSRTDADTSPVMESAIGARGVAGSRYSGRTREEVRAELDEMNRTHRDDPRSDIYRPN